MHTRLPAGALGLLLTMTATASTPAVEAARDFRQANGHEILAEFAELLQIPNVARDQPGIRRNVDFIVEAFARRGVELEALEVRGASPLIVGKIETPGATRTIGIYVHYDGQPVDPERWSSPPWAPTLRTAAVESGGEVRPLPGPGETIDPEWRLYARAAGDDKAPLIALLAALDALAARDIPLTSNVTLMFEGEEEAGSIHLREYFAAYGDRLRADAWLICDGPVHQSRRPQLVFGVRGITAFEITVYGANRYLHSGHYGNWAPNPAHKLARLLSTMKDDDGRVLIEGFYDDVVPLTDADRAALDTVPDVDDDLMQQFGIGGSEGEGSLSDRLLLPSLNVKGFVSGTVGPTARNTIPDRATAAVDIRLVKGNDPQHMLDLVDFHVRRHGYHVVRLEPDEATRRAHPKLALITGRRGYRAARTPMDLPIVEPLVDAARAAAGDDDVILMPSLGGSLPLYLFDEMLETPTIIVPIANHDNNQHGPDENLRLANLWYGIDLMAGVLTMRNAETPGGNAETPKSRNAERD